MALLPPQTIPILTLRWILPITPSQPSVIITSQTPPQHALEMQVVVEVPPPVPQKISALLKIQHINVRFPQRIPSFDSCSTTFKAKICNQYSSFKYQAKTNSTLSRRIHYIKHNSVLYIIKQSTVTYDNLQDCYNDTCDL